MNKSGYFGIGIFHGKHLVNLGTLWRSAYQLGADYIFTIGARYQSQRSDTVSASNHIPSYNYSDFDSFLSHQPHNATLIAVEFGGKPLTTFHHPKQAVYLLGAEDHGLPSEVLDKCPLRLSIPAINIESYNVSVAGSIVMYDRLSKTKFTKFQEFSVNVS